MRCDPSPDSDKKAVSSLRASSSSQPFLVLSKRAFLDASPLVCLCWHIRRPSERQASISPLVDES
jgi:hypothetical protein